MSPMMSVVIPIKFLVFENLEISSNAWHYVANGRQTESNLFESLTGRRQARFRFENDC